ncbi:unnamed protein product [Closterium sp. NIES-54]
MGEASDDATPAMPAREGVGEKSDPSTPTSCSTHCPSDPAAPSPPPTAVDPPLTPTASAWPKLFPCPSAVAAGARTAATRLRGGGDRTPAQPPAASPSASPPSPSPSPCACACCCGLPTHRCSGGRTRLTFLSEPVSPPPPAVEPASPPFAPPPPVTPSAAPAAAPAEPQAAALESAGGSAAEKGCFSGQGGDVEALCGAGALCCGACGDGSAVHGLPSAGTAASTSLTASAHSRGSTSSLPLPPHASGVASGAAEAAVWPSAAREPPTAIVSPTSATATSPASADAHSAPLAAVPAAVPPPLLPAAVRATLALPALLLPFPCTRGSWGCASEGICRGGGGAAAAADVTVAEAMVLVAAIRAAAGGEVAGVTEGDIAPLMHDWLPLQLL